jgi:hypothetical protein
MMADALNTIKVMGTSSPRLNDGDLPGYKPKPPLFPPGTAPSPYVKDRAGMVWFFEPWMLDMGDTLIPCWEAPPKPAVRVAMSAMDIEHYGKQAPQAAPQPAPAPVQAPANPIPAFAMAAETQNL